MSIPVTCQASQFNFQVKDVFAGKHGKCLKCRHVIHMPAGDAQKVTAAYPLAVAISGRVQNAN